MKRRVIPYSEQELQWISDNRQLVIGELHEKFCENFNRQDVTAQNLHSLRKRKGWKTGRSGHFPKGHVPWTAGRKLPFNPNSAATQFKKGQLPHNTKKAGHEHVRNDGYIEISIEEKNPHTGFERRFVLKHRHLWEAANGPLADDMVLKCLNGDKQNCAPSNWKPIPRAMLPRLNGRFGRNYDSAPAELKPVIMTIAELEHRRQTIVKDSRSTNPTALEGGAPL